MRFHTSRDYIQRGAGIGSFFSSIYRAVVPVLRAIGVVGAKAVKGPVGQAVVKKAKRSAMQAGLNIAEDAINGENILQSAKTNVKKAGGDVISYGLKKITKATKRGGKRGRQPTKRRKATADLFDN